MPTAPRAVRTAFTHSQPPHSPARPARPLKCSALSSAALTDTHNLARCTLRISKHADSHTHGPPADRLPDAAAGSIRLPGAQQQACGKIHTSAARHRPALPLAAGDSLPTMSADRNEVVGAEASRLCTQGMDRYIPARSGMNMDVASYNLGAKENAGTCDADGLLSPSKVSRRHAPRTCLLGFSHALLHSLHLCKHSHASPGSQGAGRGLSDTVRIHDHIRFLSTLSLTPLACCQPAGRVQEAAGPELHPAHRPGTHPLLQEEGAHCSIVSL